MTNVIDELSIAIELATKSHYGQVDKQGEPYILHPIRVMLQFSDEKSRIVAVLHDVIEDTELEIADLDYAGFGDSILLAIQALTKIPNENYFDYLERVKSNPIALQVKFADIKDNIVRLDSLYSIDRHEARRLEKKYRDAKNYLLKR